MIDITTEEPIPFSQLAKRMPRLRQGRPMAVSTVHRWRAPGLRGIRLEAVRVGGVWCTSWAAVQRFFDRLTNTQQPQHVTGDLDNPGIEEELREMGL